MVKTGEKRGEGEKAFLYYFVAFVLAKLSEGCALRRTLIKILLPGALFASCSTENAGSARYRSLAIRVKSHD